jgi:hypothetical protein
MCIAPGDCSDKADLWEKTLDQVSRELTATYQEIRAEFPKAPVLVTAYPIPIFTTTSGTAVKCDQVALSNKDLQFISSFLPKLNATVKEAALKEGFYFLDKMEVALKEAHLQLCDPENDGRPGVNFIGLRSVAGIAEQRFNPQNWYHNSLHPNARGHAAMLEVFEEWKAQNPKLGITKPETADGTEPSDANDPPLCDLNPVKKSGTPGCRDLGTKWALGQVSDKLLKSGWLIQFAVAAVGAWLLGVAFYAWWKPWWKSTSPGHPLPHPADDVTQTPPEESG